MEVILQENYPSLGYVGETIEVKRGYARNFLIPRGIAIEATSGNAKVLRHRVATITRKQARLLKEAQKFAQEMNGLILEFKLLMGKHGKSFGSITIRDIETSLREKDIVVDRRQIRLLEPIKAVGEYPVEIKLHSQCSGTITVRVLRDEKSVALAKATEAQTASVGSEQVEDEDQA